MRKPIIFILSLLISAICPMAQAGNPGDCPNTGSDLGTASADINEDCYVDLQDFAELSQQWNQCNDPEDPDCQSWFQSQRAPRLLVTKVYPAHGLLTHDDFQQIAQAGFTTAVNRWTENVPRYAQYAAAAGLNSMSWESGLVDADTLAVPHTVTSQGNTTRYSLPYDHQAWTNRTNQIVARAYISLTTPQFKGVLLDFEIYDPNKTNGFAESYDDDSLTNFLQSQSLTVPDPLPPANQRKTYFSNLGLLDAFIQYQYDLVADKIIQLRTAVDAVNPNFQIGVYGWGPMIEAVMENVATQSAPVLICNAGTYGRATYNGGYNTTEPDRPALKWSLMYNAQNIQQMSQRPYPAVYLSGHDPQVVGTGDAYKFTVRQAFNSCAYATGYWIWTEWDAPQGWDKQAWIDAMMAYFQKTHNALRIGDLAWASRQPVQITDPQATPQTFIITADADNTMTAWNPLVGLKVNVTPTPPAQWATSVIADIDTIAGNERIDINNGWIEIYDPSTNIQLLRFFVGRSQTKLQTSNLN